MILGLVGLGGGGMFHIGGVGLRDINFGKIFVVVFLGGGGKRGFEVVYGILSVSER